MNEKELIEKRNALIETSKAELAKEDCDMEIVSRSQTKIDKYAEQIKAIKALNADAGFECTAAPQAGESRASYNPKAFASFGEQLIAIAKAERGFGRDDRLSSRAALGSSTGVPADGGYLLQNDFSTSLLERVYADSDIIKLCSLNTLGPDISSIDFPVVDETSRVSNVYGGVQMIWTDEAGTPPPSKPKVNTMNLKPSKIMGLYYTTNEALRDASILTSVAQRGFKIGLQEMLTEAILFGDGNAKPTGIMVSPALVTVVKETGQVAGELKAENISKMWSRMTPEARKTAVWLVNSEVEPLLDPLVFATSNQLVYSGPNGLAGASYGTIKGRPVIPCSHCAALNTTGDIILASLPDYILVDKGDMQTDQSIHIAFDSDQTCFRFKYSVAGKTAWQAPLTPAKGASQSPFVALATRTA
jgi:HK97 family phage major capsid protein